MTENLLQRLEEKMLGLLSEVEALRKEVHFLTQENVALRYDKENSTTKLQDLIGLLDSVNSMDAAMSSNVVAATPKPVLIHSEKA